MPDIRYTYIQDTSDTNRTMTVARRVVGDNIHVAWAINRCPGRKFSVDPSNTDYIVEEYVNKDDHDKFEKAKGRAIATARLDDPNEYVIVPWENRDEHPFLAIYDHLDDEQWDKPNRLLAARLLDQYIYGWYQENVRAKFWEDVKACTEVEYKETPSSPWKNAAIASLVVAGFMLVMQFAGVLR